MQEFKPESFYTQETIGGKRYTIQKLNGWDAMDGWLLIMEMIGPVFGEVIDARNVDEEMMFEKQNTFREVLTIVTSKLRTPEMKTLMYQMLEGATVDGEKLNVEEHFRGNVHHMQELVIYALKENFQGFFTESDIFQSVMGGLSKVMKGIGAE